jgi:RNA polymerase sigma-70 factor (ECF subfamily)
MIEIEDELLKWRFKRGSREALARIYEKYVHLLLSVAMGLLNDAHEAQDVVQDVFVSFARNAAGLGIRGSLRAFLATCVINRARDRVRSELSRKRHADAYMPASSDMSEPDQSLVYNERCERLNRALAELPYEQREVVVLKVKQEMTLKQIARLQGVSIGTVHGRYRYAMEKLKIFFNGEIEP